MRSAAVYSCQPLSNALDRETLIYGEIDAALTTRADVERHVLSDSSGRSRQPGLARVRSHEALVALGRAAHTVLADFEKRSLITGDLNLEGPEDAKIVEDIEQLIWSCSNTMSLVTLGRAAWSAGQLLPVANRRFHHVPPLRFRAAFPLKSSVLIVDHGDDASVVRALEEALRQAGITTNYVGSAGSAEAALRDTCWLDDALIHVHVGEHTLDADKPRLVDSWRSERLALQLITDRRSHDTKDPNALMIENEVNGIICATSEEVASVCQELFDDRILRQKLISAGQSTVAPLMKNWGAIADDLLA